MLNEYQHRSLIVTLMSVEKMLFEIEQTLKTEDYAGIVYDMKNDISDGESILSMISLARNKILVIVEQFSLQKTNKTASQQISVKLSYCWEILEDTRAKKMKKYGSIDEGIEKILDPQIDALVDLIGEMERKLLG